MKPQGLLFDYGDTLVDELNVDSQAGNEWLLSRASFRPASVDLEQIVARANQVATEVAALRDSAHLETAWPALTRLIYEFYGIRFDAPMADLELGFWKVAMHARAMPGARQALDQCHRLGLPCAVVSNTSFSEPVLRYELDKHGLADHLAFILVSSDYAVRKPNVLLFETAAARLGIQPRDIWFVGDRLDTDVAGAKAAGMTAVWFNPNTLQNPSPDPDLTVAGWDDLMRHVLRSIGSD